MIYLTQLIFVKPGKESVFQQFEDFVIPLMERHGGRMIYRVRPSQHSFISAEEERPYEIHFVSFNSEEGLQSYMKDETRLQYMHLKDDSVESIMLVKGTQL